MATNPHAILQLPTNQTVTKINVAPSRRKANARNSGTQGSPLTWARLADISGENPDGARFGGYWWLPLPILQNMTLIAVNQLFINSCLVTKNQRGTKTGQNHGKIKSRTLCPKYPLWNTSVSFAKVQICPLKNEGKSLYLSFTTHFPTIVLQMWLLQAILTSNSMTCENRVLNFVLHSDGHFQKRELAIEPKICHPYCPILGFVNV